MFGGAGVRRAVILIAATVPFVVPASGQSEVEAMVEKLAREADRAQAKKKDDTVRKADEAKAKKDAERKAAQENRAREVRKSAEAQRAKAEARRRAEESQASDEAEMLVRARREAEEAKVTEEVRHLIEQAEAARMRAEALLEEEARQARVKTTGPGRSESDIKAPPAVRDGETEQARAAEREQWMRSAANRRLVANLARVRHLREARLAVQAQRVVQEAEAERTRVAEEARLALQRAAENRRLVERLARMRQLRETRLAARAHRVETQAAAVEKKEPAPQLAELPPPVAAANVPPVVANERPPAVAPLSERAGLGGEPDRRVTVVMIMTPGTYGIRRGAKTADPVLCAIDGCYVSAGADRAALFLPRRKALGVGNTLGMRAGACRQSLGCVFRGVALGFPGTLQPVDLHILKHDRRQPQVVTADSGCNLAAGRLMCSRGIYAEDYVMWIVPERMAAAAGPDVLARAAREGLGVSRSAEFSPQPAR